MSPAGYGSAVDCCRGRASGCSRAPRYSGCGISPLGEVAINPPQSCQNLHRTGETDSCRAQTKLCVHQEKGAVIPQEADPDLPVSVQESLVEARVGSDLLQGWGH